MMLPTKLRGASVEAAAALDVGSLVLGVVLGCALGVCCDGVAVGCAAFGSCDWDGVPWPKAAGSITSAKAAIKIKLVRFIVALLQYFKVSEKLALSELHDACQRVYRRTLNILETVSQAVIR